MSNEAMRPMELEATELEPKQEPVMIWQGLVVPILMGLSLFFNLNTDVQSAVDAFLLAAGGVVAAFGVDWRSAMPLLGGGIKALFSLLAGLGLGLPPHVQVATMAVVSAVVAYVTQSQVVAKPKG